jgi:hypothetical protein
MYLPFKQPVEVKADDTIVFHLKTRPLADHKNKFWFWRAQVFRQGINLYKCEGLDYDEHAVATLKRKLNRP